MGSGLESIKDYVEFLSYIVTSLTLIGLWTTFALSRKQIHFSAMEKCINDFREIDKSSNSTDQNSLAKQYIELVNEEFFYLKNNYLPIEVSVEWVDGMIDYLPFIQKTGEFHKSKELNAFSDKQATNNLLRNYPRVRKVIQLEEHIDFEKLLEMDDEKSDQVRKERDKLIFSMISNLNIGFWTKRRLKSAIGNR